MTSIGEIMRQWGSHILVNLKGNIYQVSNSDCLDKKLKLVLDLILNNRTKERKLERKSHDGVTLLVFLLLKQEKGLHRIRQTEVHPHL